MEIDNRWNRIGRFGFMCPADFRSVSAPELADRKKSNIAGEKEPAIDAWDHRRAFTFSRAQFCRQFVNEFLLRIGQRNRITGKDVRDRQRSKNSGVKKQIMGEADSFPYSARRQ